MFFLPSSLSSLPPSFPLPPCLSLLVLLHGPILLLFLFLSQWLELRQEVFEDFGIHAVPSSLMFHSSSKCIVPGRPAVDSDGSRSEGRPPLGGGEQGRSAGEAGAWEGA